MAFVLIPFDFSQGWKWSGHTHPPGYYNQPSLGDINVLKAMKQNQSAIWSIVSDPKTPRIFFADQAAEDAVAVARNAKLRAGMIRRLEGQ